MLRNLIIILMKFGRIYVMKAETKQLSNAQQHYLKQVKQQSVFITFSRFLLMFSFLI